MPRIGAGPLVFGMQRSQVIDLFSDNFTTGFRSNFDAHPSDYFLETGIIAGYDTFSLLEFIEIVHPAQAFLYDRDMLQMNFQEAMSFLTGYDQLITSDEYGGLSKALGVGFWTSRGADDAEDDPIQNVYVFRDGYYDQ